MTALAAPRSEAIQRRTARKLIHSGATATAIARIEPMAIGTVHPLGRGAHAPHHQPRIYAERQALLDGAAMADQHRGAEPTPAQRTGPERLKVAHRLRIAFHRPGTAGAAEQSALPEKWRSPPSNGNRSTMDPP